MHDYWEEKKLIGFPWLFIHDHSRFIISFGGKVEPEFFNGHIPFSLNTRFIIAFNLL